MLKSCAWIRIINVLDKKDLMCGRCAGIRKNCTEIRKSFAGIRNSYVEVEEGQYWEKKNTEATMQFNQL